METVRPRVLSFLLVLGSLIGLSANTTSCDDRKEKKSDSTQTKGNSDPPRTATVFIDPHGGGFQLSSDHRSDVQLRVANPFLGRTQLAIDGRLQGTLTRPGPIGQLNLKTLRLRVKGGLIPSRHYLQFVTTGVAGPAFSPQIVLDVLPGPHRHPFVLIDPISWLKCNNIDAIDGTEYGIVFLGIDEDPLLAKVCRGTSADTCADFRGPDLVAIAAEPERFSLTVLEQQDKTVLRIAWLRGQPAETVMWQSFLWDETKRDTPLALTGESVIDRSALPPSEWSEFREVMWFEGNLLVGFQAQADTESPRPGDRGILAIPWNPAKGTSHLDPKFVPDRNAMRRINGDWTDDIDHLGSIIDSAYREFSLNPGFIARFGRTRPAHLIPEELALVRVENLTSPSGPRIMRAVHSLAMVRGAFGSQTIAAIDHVGRHQVVVGDQLQLNAQTISSPQQAAPPGPPSAAIAAGLIAGQPVFLVPFGARRKTQAIISNGSVARAVDLDLYCDQVLTMEDTRNLDPDQLGLICLINGEIKRGILDSHV